MKEERGLGLTLDVILFDGTLTVGDQVMLATADGVIQTKVKSLLKPRPMKEILTEDRFERVKSVVAASGVKVAAPGLDGVIAGSPLRVVRGSRDAIEQEILDEVSRIDVVLSDEGLVIKADTIGALEALSKELETREIGVMRAAVGPVSRHDLVDAQTIKAPLCRAVLAFNAPLLPDAQAIVREGGPDLPRVFQAKVIYQLIDEFVEWRDTERQRMEQQRFERIILPAKLRVLPGCVFRQSNPAVVGVRVLGGTLRTDVNLIRTDGRKAGHLKTIQSSGEYVHEVEAGAEVAIAIEGATVGRQARCRRRSLCRSPRTACQGPREGDARPYLGHRKGGARGVHDHAQAGRAVLGQVNRIFKSPPPHIYGYFASVEIGYGRF